MTTSFAEWIADGGRGDVPAWWELCLYDVQPAAVLGADRSLLASGRLDNLVSCWAATTALVGRRAGRPRGDDRPVRPRGGRLGEHDRGLRTVPGHRPRAAPRRRRRRPSTTSTATLAASSCVSADNAHAVHPNYPERHDPDHGPIVNQGPAIKLNANQRYATSADTAALFRRACERRRRAVADVRVAQQHAVRLDDRPADGDPARHRHRRRRRPPAVDALRPRALRRRRSRLARRRPDRPTCRPSPELVSCGRGAGPRRTAPAASRAARR